MNKHRLGYIMAHIRSKGPLPRDVTGMVLSPDDLLGWFDFRERLTGEERTYVKRELEAMGEAEMFVERIRLGGR